jgi:hypothetical protein
MYPFLFVTFQPNAAKWVRYLLGAVSDTSRVVDLCGQVDYALSDRSGQEGVSGQPFEEEFQPALAKEHGRLVRNRLGMLLAMPDIGEVCHLTVCLDLEGSAEQTILGLPAWVDGFRRYQQVARSPMDISVLLLVPSSVGGDSAGGPPAGESMLETITKTWGDVVLRLRENPQGAAPLTTWFWLVASEGLGGSGAEGSHTVGFPAAALPNKPFLEAQRFLLTMSEVLDRNFQVAQHAVAQFEEEKVQAIFSACFSRVVHFPRDRFVEWLRLNLRQEIIRNGPLGSLPYEAEKRTENGPEDSCDRRVPDVLQIIRLPQAPPTVPGRPHDPLLSSTADRRAELSVEALETRIRPLAYEQVRNEIKPAQSMADQLRGEWQRFLDSLLTETLSNPAVPLQRGRDALDHVLASLGGAFPKGGRRDSVPSSVYEAVQPEVTPVLQKAFQTWIREWTNDSVRVTGRASFMVPDPETVEDWPAEVDRAFKAFEEQERASPFSEMVFWSVFRPLLSHLATQVREKTGMLSLDQTRELRTTCEGTWQEIRSRLEESLEYRRRRRAEIAEEEAALQRDFGQRKSRCSVWARLFKTKGWRDIREAHGREEAALEQKKRLLDEQFARLFPALWESTETLRRLMPPILSWEIATDLFAAMEQERKARLKAIEEFENRLQQLADEARRTRDGIVFPSSELVISIPRKEDMKELYDRLGEEIAGESGFLPAALTRLAHSAVAIPDEDLQADRPTPLTAFMRLPFAVYIGLLDRIADQFFSRLGTWRVTEMFVWLNAGNAPHLVDTAIHTIAWPPGILGSDWNLHDRNRLMFISVHETDRKHWEDAAKERVWPGETVCLGPLTPSATGHPHTDETDVCFHTYIHGLRASDLAIFRRLRDGGVLG